MEGKYNLELNYPGDGRCFLNHWDYRHGNDVVAEIKEGKLFVDDKEVSFADYQKLVEESLQK